MDRKRQMTIEELCDRDCILVKGGTKADTLVLEFVIGTKTFPWVVVVDDHGRRQVFKCRDEKEVRAALREHKNGHATAYAWIRRDFSWSRRK